MRRLRFPVSTSPTGKTSWTWIPRIRISSVILCCGSRSIGRARAPAVGVRQGIAQKIAPAMGAVLTEPLGGRAATTSSITKAPIFQGGTVMVYRPNRAWSIASAALGPAESVGAGRLRGIPQNASHNPTLTILATTTWASDALIERYLSVRECGVTRPKFRRAARLAGFRRFTSPKQPVRRDKTGKINR